MLKPVFMGFCLIVLCIGTAQGDDPQALLTSATELTSEERSWLASHPEIHIGITNNWPPMNYVDEKGVPRGIGVDYLSAVNRHLKGALNIVPAPFRENFEAVKSKSLDALTDITPRPDREPYFNFTTPYLTIPQVIVGRKKGPYLDGEKDLCGRSVALERGYYTITTFRRDFPEIKIQEYNNTSDCLDAVSRGEADAYVGNRAVAIYITERELITNLRLMGRTSVPPIPLTIGVRKDWPEFAVILDKILLSLSQQEIRDIHRKWAKSTDLSAKSLALTPEEYAWLAKDHTVRVRVISFPPFIIAEKGREPAGISIEYLSRIAECTGIRLRYVFSTRPWKEAIEGLKQKQGPDLITPMMRTTERESFISFSEEYFSSPRVIFTRADSSPVYEMNDLTGKTVAVVRGTAVHERLESDHPGTKLIFFAKDESALESVATGRADAYIGNLALASYLILKRGFANIRVAAPSSLGDHVLSFAIRKDWPELTRIINKGLDAIRPEERLAIRNRHISVQYADGRFADVMRWVLIFVGIASGILLFLFLWNRSLARQVCSRTSDLEEANRLLHGEIRDRKQAEEELRQSRDYLSHITDSIWDAVFSVKIPDREIEWVNDSFSVFGYDSGESVGRTTEFLYQDRDTFLRLGRQLKNAVAEGRKMFHTEALFKRKNGEIFPAEITVTLYKEKGEIISSTSVVRDISERRRAEKEKRKLEASLTQAQKMEAIGILAGGIAHDFNNILTVIIGCAELAMNEVEKGSLLEEFLWEIYTGGMRAGDLVTQILTFARRAEKKIQPVQVSTIAKEVIKFIRASLPATVDIREKIGSSALTMADPTQIHQIFMNLCTNAAHAMKNDGTLEISLTDIMPDEADNACERLRPAEYLKLSVSDTGTGISPDITESVFEPYFTTKPPGEGTGLGLAVVHGIVRDCGGEITVESEPGKGTVFNVYLPVSKTSESPKCCHAEPLPSGTERILFVDNEPSIVKISETLLSGIGYSVTACTDCSEALTLFRSEPGNYDLVITDMTMPKMTGEKLATELRKIRADIPVILCTGYYRKSGSEKADTNIKAVLSKPVTTENMAKTVRDVLDQAKKAG